MVHESNFTTPIPEIIYLCYLKYEIVWSVAPLKDIHRFIQPKIRYFKSINAL